MFFLLSKLLLFLLSPFFWICALVVLFFFTKNSRWKRRFKRSAIFIAIFFTNTVIFSEFCRIWEVPGVRMENVKQHDVAIVLGGMSEYNNDLDVLSLRRSGDRLVQALSLYHKGKVKKIMISGDSGHVSDRGLHEAKQMKELLLLWNVPEEDIITEEISKNTYENAKYSVRILNRDYPQFSSFILVTSGIHMKRSLACFEKQGMKCTPHSTDLYSNRTRNYHWDQYIFPNVDNFNQWNRLLKERVGYTVYYLKDYL